MWCESYAGWWQVCRVLTFKCLARAHIVANFGDSFFLRLAKLWRLNLILWCFNLLMAQLADTFFPDQVEPFWRRSGPLILMLDPRGKGFRQSHKENMSRTVLVGGWELRGIWNGVFACCHHTSLRLLNALLLRWRKRWEEPASTWICDMWSFPMFAQLNRTCKGYI